MFELSGAFNNSNFRKKFINSSTYRTNVYLLIFKTELGETLEVQCEPENPVDKYAVCLKTDNWITIGHFKKGESGRFAKTIFYYLPSHPDTKCTAIVTGKRFNLGDGEGSALYFENYRGKKICIYFNRAI